MVQSSAPVSRSSERAVVTGASPPFRDDTTDDTGVPRDRVQFREGNAVLYGGPRVRIRFPPAESLSLGRIHFRRSRTPAFRAGVRGWLGDRVGRDAPRVSIARQPAAISLSGHIPVPQCP